MAVSYTHLDVYKRQNTNHATQSGKYTLVIPGGTNDTVTPGGHGYSSVTVSALGSITASGALSDGTSFSQNTTLSELGNWPFYVSLYSGAGEICLLYTSRCV